MRESISADQAQTTVEPYSQAVKVGELIFRSGQIAFDPGGDALSGMILKTQEQVMRNIAAAPAAFFKPRFLRCA